MQLQFILLFSFLFLGIECLSFQRHIERDELSNKLKKKNTLPLQREEDEYYGIIEIGSPAQEMRITVDPGFSDFWVVSSKFKGTDDGEHNKYDSSKSRTHKDNGTEAIITWDGATMKSVLSTDGIIINDISLKNYTFAEIIADDIGILYMITSDGVIGLGKSEKSSPTRSLVLSLYEQKLIEKPLVSFHILPKSSAKLAGELLFGQVDRSYFVGDLAYTNALQSTGAWQFNMQTMEVIFENRTVFSQCKDNCSVTLDTANSIFMYGEYGLVDKINAALGATLDLSGLYEVDCSLEELPDIVIRLGNKNFTLKPEQYVMHFFGSCVTLFQWNFNAAIKTDWTFGWPVMRILHTVLDYENNRIGFAEAKF